ncbi:MAG: hypothetical protein P8101_15855 [Candidatus Thiodiazotropha sp.]
MVAAALFCCISIAKADSWEYLNEYKEYKYEFGKTIIIKSIDATQNSKYPDFILKIYNNNELLAQYRNIWFSDIFATKQQDLFVGLSNGGIPGTALVIFNSRGDLLLEIKHDYGQFKYCDNPGFDVEYADNNIDRKIYINDCTGKRILLQDLIDKSYGK